MKTIEKMVLHYIQDFLMVQKAEKSNCDQCYDLLKFLRLFGSNINPANQAITTENLK